MKNWIIIILVVAYCTTIAFGAKSKESRSAKKDSTVVISKKHKRVLRFKNRTRKSGHTAYRVPTKVDTFIDKDRDGINDLLNKRQEKTSLFHFLDKKASTYFSKEKPSIEKKKSYLIDYRISKSEEKISAEKSSTAKVSVKEKATKVIAKKKPTEEKKTTTKKPVRKPSKSKKVRK